MLNGQEIKEYRLTNDIQQQEVATLAGVNKSSISQVENGRTGISDEMYGKIMNGLYKAIQNKKRKETEVVNTVEEKTDIEELNIEE